MTNLVPGGVATADLPDEPLADYAASVRPAAERRAARRPAYLRQLWRRRSFILAFATARNIAMYTEARLGQLWQILTPLLNAGVYFLIFGLLLHVNRGIPNYLAFLVTGVFVFNFTQRAFISGFDRDHRQPAADPGPAVPAGRAAAGLRDRSSCSRCCCRWSVLAVIVVATGEPITWYWLLAIPALLLQTIFNVGVGLFVARLGSQVNDFSQLLPFLLRTWMYVSGVLFNIGTLSHRARTAGSSIALQLNPAALYITLVRNALLLTQRESTARLEAIQRPAVRAVGHARAQGGRPGEVSDGQRVLPLRTPTRTTSGTTP